MESNYEKTKRQMQLEFLKYDQTKMIDRFHLEADEHYLRFPFIGSGCRVDRKTGAVECAVKGEFREAGFNEAMTVYDLLCWSKPEAFPSGQYVSMESLSSYHIGSVLREESSLFVSRAKLLDHRIPQLCGALRSIGGLMTESGDAAAYIDVFDGLKALFRFWNSDEDFGPQIQFLWDKNVLLYMHYETVWYAGGIIVSRICEAMPASADL